MRLGNALYLLDVDNSCGQMLAPGFIGLKNKSKSSFKWDAWKDNDKSHLDISFSSSNHRLSKELMATNLKTKISRDKLYST